jgi:ADP-L-glycero-D-manno-heptose 6-epimerase
MTFLVTGGAGFVGSNLLAKLNEQGHTDVVVCDTLGKGDKWRNLSGLSIADLVPPADLARWLDRWRGRGCEAVFHLGAISDTTASDADLVVGTNFRGSLELLDWCVASRTPFIYASSAATYGNGEDGFDDDCSPEAMRRLRPLNLYGWSKHLFDLAVVHRHARNEMLPAPCVGLKFFNVYGPRERHKGRMASLVSQRLPTAREGSPIRLFKSYRQGIPDGEQKRDFIHVDDVVAVLLWALEQRPQCGIFNLGTGKARSFNELAMAMFRALGRAPSIEYVDMPSDIREQYQYFTQAKMDRLRAAGYVAPFIPLDEGVKLYVDRADAGCS